MKKIIALLVSLLFLPLTSVAGSEPDQYWVCSQAGRHGKTHLQAVSHVFRASANDYETKEAGFEAAVQEQTNKQFEGEYDAHCRDFTSLTKAEKYLKKMLSRAEKRSFNILWIKFSY